MKLSANATVRSATSADVPLMMQLERQCPSAAHWTEQQYAELFRAGEGGIERLVLVVDARLNTDSEPKESRMAFMGFLAARRVAQEWELENMVIVPNARRKGLGRLLVEALLSKARETNCESVFLEVRESNTAARSLYEQAGFQTSGRRKSYYANPHEDAILCRLSLP